MLTISTKEASAQVVLEDRPTAFVPSRPETRQERNQREARKLYGLGQMRLQDDRLVDATRIFEEALPLDPEASPLYKALIPLYLALGRSNDALGACRKVLELDPGDYETWVLYAKQLKSRGELKPARAALERALACLGIGERLDLHVQLAYDLGALCEEMKAYADAVDAFQEVVKILDNPQPLLDLGGFDRIQLQEQAANTYERMINLCIANKEYERALALFAAGKEKHPVLERRLDFNLAKVEWAQGRPEKALEYLDAYLQTQPRGIEAYELRAKVLKQLHRETEILPALEAYRKRDAHNVALSLLLARQYADAKQWKESEQEYLRLAEEAPSPELYRGLFRLCREQLGTADGMGRVLMIFDQTIGRSQKQGKGQEGDPQAAAQARAMLSALRADPVLTRDLVPAAQRALQNTPEPPVFHLQTLFILAVLARRTHQLTEAEQFYRSSLLDKGVHGQEQLIYSGLIDVLLQAHKYEAVAEVCRQGLSHTEKANHHFFYNNLSRALVISGRIEEGVTAADQAVAIAPQDERFWARRNRCWVLYRAERYPQAVAEGQAMLKEFAQPGQTHEVRLLLSTVYSAMHDLDKAEEQIQQVLKDDPNNATANNNLGYQWADQGKNLDEAERLIRKAIDLDQQQRKSRTNVGGDDEGESAAFLDSLGWVLFRRGRLAEARAWLEKAAALPGGEDDPTVWDHLGDLYQRLNDRARARTARQKALDLCAKERRQPTGEQYQELKQKLQLLGE
jgi:tetratricopeptide (TPR) repeat protein